MPFYLLYELWETPTQMQPVYWEFVNQKEAEAEADSFRKLPRTQQCFWKRYRNIRVIDGKVL